MFVSIPLIKWRAIRRIGDDRPHNQICARHGQVAFAYLPVN